MAMEILTNYYLDGTQIVFTPDRDLLRLILAGQMLAAGGLGSSSSQCIKALRDAENLLVVAESRKP